jgi:hypothetical protein
MQSQQRKLGGETAEIVGWPMPSHSPSPCSAPVPSAEADRVATGERAAKAAARALSIGPLSHDPMARLVLAEVGRAFATEQGQLLSTGRCAAPIALARQVAMYLLHVELGRHLSEVGRLLGRDRTTVSHACAHVEDLREDSSFDGRIDDIELAIRLGRLPANCETGAKHVERA